MNFRGMITKPNISEEIELINSTGIGEFITYSLQFAAQVHVWHWLSKSGQKHTALGELYEEIQSEVDSLAEKFIAQGGFPTTVSEPIVALYDESMVRGRISEYRDMITRIISDEPELASLNDSLIDIQEILDKKLYMFNLD